MRILVTGASGNVGRYVVDYLLKMNEEVVAGSSRPESSKFTQTYQLSIVEFDFTQSKTFDNALCGVDRVFLMRPPHLGKPEDLYPFIDAMKRHEIKLVVFLSLMGVENNPIPPHHKIEKYIEKVGLPYAHIRPGFFMQNISGIHAEEIRKLNQIYVPAGRSKTSFIDARDIGFAAATLLNDPIKYANTSHTITGSESLDYDEIAMILSRVTGRKITYPKIGYLKYRRHYIKIRKLDPKYVNVTIALYFMTRMGTASRITDEYHKLTGKEPNTFIQFAYEHKSVFE